jgi:predicted HD superfamily hydrolase involved in NAD metabolism
MTLEEMQNKLRNVLSRDRFEHSKNVMNTAVELAIIYRVDKNKAAIAGLLHDCAKGYRGEDALAFCRKYNIKIDDIMKIQTGLLHGPIGSYLAEHEYGIKDPSILRAIFYHTTGCENMDILAKIIYIADYIEPKRNFIGVKISFIHC